MDQRIELSPTVKNRKLGLRRKLLLGTALVASLAVPTVAGMSPAAAAGTIRTLDVYPLQDDCSMTVIGYGNGIVEVVISCPDSGDEGTWF
ncbi:MAG TPA: hypothetical protein VF045_08925 [Acidimicrobiales bacterium]